MAGKIEVLLVDDDPVDLGMTARELRRDNITPGFSLRQASTLAEAHTSLSATPFDVIVLDLGLEETQGVDTVRAFSRIVGDTPMVVLTGSRDQTVGLVCIEAGADDFVCKDRRREELPRALEFSARRTRARNTRRKRVLEAWRSLSNAPPLRQSDYRGLEAELYEIASMQHHATEVASRILELTAVLRDRGIHPTSLARALASTPYDKPGAVVELGNALVACLGDAYFTLKAEER